MAQEYRQVWRFYVPKRDGRCAVSEKDSIILEEEESRLATAVLRLKEGELVELSDGAGWVAKGLISDIRKKNIAVRIESQKFIEKNRIRKIVLVGYPKPGALDEVVQVCVDSGVDELIFFRGDKSTSKQEFKSDKLQKQVLELTRITKSPWLLEVSFCQSLVEAFAKCNSAYCDQKLSFFVCDERPSHILEQKSAQHMLDGLRNSAGFSWVAVVGPEGSFSASEYEQMQNILSKERHEFVSLGPRILRTPAAVAAATWFMAGLKDMCEN